MTIEQLRQWGADTEKGIARCMGNEAFYLRMVGMLRGEPNTAKLAASVAAGDLDGAFEAAHTLKGVLANLELTPALTPVAEITEQLRGRREMDYGPLTARIQTEMDALQRIIAG